MRIHRQGYLEARSIELELPDASVRRAQQSHSYLTLGFEMEVEKEVGISLEGATRCRVLTDVETMKQRVLIEEDWQKPTRR